MLTFIIRIIAFIATLWIVRWIIHLLSGKRRQESAAERARKSPSPAQKTVRDPVCGMYLDPRLAVRLDQPEGDMFFCSKACKDKYLANPN